jgi:hypothetical protein
LVIAKNLVSHKIRSSLRQSLFSGGVLVSRQVAQHSMHPTLGILARFRAFFYASAFFQSDGVPPPAHLRVTQTVGQFSQRNHKRNFLQLQVIEKENSNECTKQVVRQEARSNHTNECPK